MKKLLAMLLSLVMLLVLVPAATAEGADYTLVIEGGNVADHLEMVNGKNLLAVDVKLNEAVEETIIGLTFDLTYDPAQLIFAKDEEDEENKFDGFVANDAIAMPTVNDTVAGTLRCAFVSVEGIPAAEQMDVMTLYFEVAEGLEAGTEITFELVNGAFAETFTDDASKVTPHDIDADFAPFVLNSEIFSGVVKFNEGEVEYKGQTPYVIWDSAKAPFEPAFTVYEEDGETVIGPENYDFEYKENAAPGTGYLFVYFKGVYSGTAQLFFKIYLSATTKTTVENVANGILVTWAPVEGAAGYVIYRRAWSSTTNGWTAFARWDNTTETNYLDGHDDAHKTYAGTRYQYGVKAYFARRTDPVSGAEIGGNVNEDSGNFNLGMVGPLKTTVRITTRELKSVTPGTKEMTINWTPTKNFTGIQVQYAEDANFKTNSKNYKVEYTFTLDEEGNVVGGPVPSEDVIKELTSGKTYYVRIRSYCLFEGMNYYGEWSNVLNCKVN
jgi:hypothetical protein